MISFDYWRQRFVYLTKKKIDKIEGGLAEIYFNDKGLMDHVKISVSKTSNGTALNQTMLEHIQISDEDGTALLLLLTYQYMHSL